MTQISTGDPYIAREVHEAMLEVKDGSKPPSDRELTPDQVKWHIAWRGQVAVVTSVEEAIAAVSAEGNP